MKKIRQQAASVCICLGFRARRHEEVHSFTALPAMKHEPSADSEVLGTK